MTISGTSTFTETRDQIISDTLQLIGVLAAGETVSSADLAFCASALNKMVKSLVAQGIHLWTTETGTIFLINGQNQYNLQAGSGGTPASDGTGTPVETTLVSGSGTSIVVINGTGMSPSDTIGVCLTNNTIQWTTITTVSGNTIGLTTGLTSLASAGNAVYSYTTQLPRVVNIHHARLRNNYGFDRMMEIYPRNDYMSIPQKALSGDPIILYYSPQVSQGQVYVWPTPYNVNSRIEITYTRTLDDFDTGTDSPDFPQEWLEPLTYNLAVRVAPAYGINLSSGGITGNPDILVQAKQYLLDMKAWDSEEPFIKIIPKWR